MQPGFGRGWVALDHSPKQSAKPTATGSLSGEAFQITMLGTASSPGAARRLERKWIERLGTKYPTGFNLMPGGSSLGGPSNAQPVRVKHPVRGRTLYPSLMSAVEDISRERVQSGRAPMALGAVYARLHQWSAEQALELVPHRDGRRLRAPFYWRGVVYRTIHEVAQAEGLCIATIRSRLWRARRAGCGPDHDMATDRRRQRAHGRQGARGRPPRSLLPHPLEQNRASVSAAIFERLTGVAASTALSRLHRFADGREPSTLPRAELLAALTQSQVAPIMLELELPGEGVLTGCVRGLIRQVLADPHLRWARSDPWLTFSAMRSRLRRIPG